MKKMVSKSTHISLSIVLYAYLLSLNFQFCVLYFLSKKYDPHFWGGEIFFLILERVVCLGTLWVENFDEITLSHTVKEIQAVLCFAR